MRGRPFLDTVFLDRDGTLNVKADEGRYVTSPADLVMLPGAVDAVRRLNATGARVIVVTNQRGVARGLMSRQDLDRVHDRLHSLLAAGGARVDAVLACPHAADSCDCRKPLPGLVTQAADRFAGLSPTRSAMVGDADSDVELGLRLGMLTVRLGTEAARKPLADHTVPTLAAAVEVLAPLVVKGPRGAH
ncbi:HAD family hydrolase [Motilibacter sp. K478]|nr:HAD family hydrolase [Motilibacter aurantiacus]NHC44748.1 HAD family hydrolase [Motilibacter aurantiacus]